MLFLDLRNRTLRIERRDPTLLSMLCFPGWGARTAGKSFLSPFPGRFTRRPIRPVWRNWQPWALRNIVDLRRHPIAPLLAAHVAGELGTQQLGPDGEARHHFDFAQAGETTNTTASQRSAARRRASCHRSPAAKPRWGSTSRNTSSQPFSVSQCLRATASSSSVLEWLRKMRDMSSS